MQLIAAHGAPNRSEPSIVHSEVELVAREGDLGRAPHKRAARLLATHCDDEVARAHLALATLGNLALLTITHADKHKQEFGLEIGVSRVGTGARGENEV